MVELLAPAGSPEAVTAAVQSGANAVYLSFEDLMKDIEKYKKKDYRILILSPSATRGKRIAKNLQDNDVMAYFTENREQPLKPGEVRISVGRMETGFEIPECHLLVIAEGDIFTSKELKKRKNLR